MLSPLRRCGKTQSFDRCSRQSGGLEAPTRPQRRAFAQDDEWARGRWTSLPIRSEGSQISGEFQAPISPTPSFRNWLNEALSRFGQKNQYLMAYSRPEAFMTVNQKTRTSIKALTVVLPMLLTAGCSTPFPQRGNECSKDLNSESVFSRSIPAIATVSTGSNIGSGFVVKSDKDKNTSLIVTNSHVVSKRDIVQVSFEGSEKVFVGRVIGDLGDTTNEKDLALVEIQSYKENNLPIAEVETGIGSEIYAIGAPRGLQYSMTKGIVSQIRNDGQIIQLDAAINPGNSGGPVLNKKGCVIGVAVSKRSDSEGIAFAISAENVNDFLKYPTVEINRWKSVFTDRNTDELVDYSNIDNVKTLGNLKWHYFYEMPAVEGLDHLAKYKIMSFDTSEEQDLESIDTIGVICRRIENERLISTYIRNFANLDSPVGVGENPTAHELNYWRWNASNEIKSQVIKYDHQRAESIHSAIFDDKKIIKYLQLIRSDMEQNGVPLWGLDGSSMLDRYQAFYKFKGRLLDFEYVYNRQRHSANKSLSSGPNTAYRISMEKYCGIQLDKKPFINDQDFDHEL